MVCIRCDLKDDGGRRPPSSTPDPTRLAVSAQTAKTKTAREAATLLLLWVPCLSGSTIWSGSQVGNASRSSRDRKYVACVMP